MTKRKTEGKGVKPAGRPRAEKQAPSRYRDCERDEGMTLNPFIKATVERAFISRFHNDDDKAEIQFASCDLPGVTVVATIRRTDGAVCFRDQSLLLSLLDLQVLSIVAERQGFDHFILEYYAGVRIANQEILVQHNLRGVIDGDFKPCYPAVREGNCERNVA